MWKERGIYDAAFIDDLKRNLSKCLFTFSSLLISATFMCKFLGFLVKLLSRE